MPIHVHSHSHAHSPPQDEPVDTVRETALIQSHRSYLHTCSHLLCTSPTYKQLATRRAHTPDAAGFPRNKLTLRREGTLYRERRGSHSRSWDIPGGRIQPPTS
ncbi:hypothetical protein XENTR_v10005947 [Xenopus tropicalis]|nr:hypothetical protein XENTR_v10005947 [Xenopus tropicalis]